MDAPPIQYARTEDGVNIAYWTVGEREKPALILMGGGADQITELWTIGGTQAWYERLSRSFFLVAYDARGSGLSRRGSLNLARERLAADIATVAAEVGLREYALFASARATMVAIAHAADCPTAVTHLVLWAPLSRGFDDAERRLIVDVRHGDWDGMRRLVGMGFTGFSHPDEAAQVSAMWIKSTSPEEWQALVDEMDQLDVRDLLPQVEAGTLVFGLDPGFNSSPLRAAQDVAAGIPNAKLLVVNEDTGFMQFGDRELYAAAIEELVLSQDRAVSPQGDAQPIQVSEGHPRQQPPENPDGLSPRELEVLGQVALGRRNSEIAESLVISPATVTRHVSNILTKTGLSNRTKLATYATDHGLRGGEGL